MSGVFVRYFREEDLNTLAEIIEEAWNYYSQEIDPRRLRELLRYYLQEDESKMFFLAFEDGNVVGVAEVTIVESYRYEGEEARLDLIYIRDEASNYYDVNSAIMDAVFNFLKDEKVEYLRADTTLENADVLYI